MFTRRTDSRAEDRMENSEVAPNIQRRAFLKYVGMGSALITATAAISSCKKDHDTSSSGGVSLGTGDYAVLNYAYALEQLEAAFYTKLVSSFYSGATAGEKALLTDIRNHEIAHREFFKAALGTHAIASLSVDFSSIDFTSRASVLGAAAAFENLGVSAYNGAGQYIANADYLLLAGKIVSVEARHAAYINDLLISNSLAASGQIDSNGMDISQSPAQVFAKAGTYITTKIDLTTLPK